MEISGDAMLAKAKEYAEELNLTNFSASRGYLANFKNRYGIKFKKLHGEGGTVPMDIVDSWTIVLPDDMLLLWTVENNVQTSPCWMPCRC